MGHRTRPEAAGGCLSGAAREAKIRSDLIDQQLEEAQREHARDAKVLVLGPSMSGKSTLIKHMMCMTGSVSLPERQALKPIILSSVSMAMSLIVEEAKALGVFRYDPELKSHARTIATLSGHSTDPTAVYKIPRALKALWADERIVKVFYGCREQYPGLDDAVEYYLNNISRIGSLSYVPNDQDILHLHVKTLGIQETVVPYGDMNLRVCDVGHQVSDPRKWLHYFDDVRVVVYVVSLSDYETSSIRDDLSDFISFCELECIDKSPIMLLFSHADKLEEKLPAQPLGDSYPEYNGPNDMEAAARFIAGMFTQAAPHRQVSTYFGRGLDSIAMRDTVAAINNLVTVRCGRRGRPAS